MHVLLEGMAASLPRLHPFQNLNILNHVHKKKKFLLAENNFIIFIIIVVVNVEPILNIMC